MTSNDGQAAHTGDILDTVEGVSVVDCTVCGFAHVTPRPSEELLKKFYTKEFYDTEKPEYFKYAEEDKDWWAATYDRYYTLLEAHTKGRRLLDIGSGPGYFLDTGVSRGWEVLGFEPSTTAAEYARGRGRTIVNELFSQDTVAPHGLFDAVMISLVLEHVPDPKQVIEQARASLKPGGVLMVIVPNDYNPLQKALATHHEYRPWWVVPTHHLNYFTVQSIERLLTTCGFKTQELETSYPMEFFLLAGRNYVGDPEVGRACHSERKKFEQALLKDDPALLGGLYRGWAAQGIGREVVIVGQKD